MKNALIYFRGYNWLSQERSGTFDRIEKMFGHYIECIMIEQNVGDYLSTIEETKKVIESHDQVFLIASSMGCIPALYFGFELDTSVILINPGYFPEETLCKLLTVGEIDNLVRFKKVIEEKVQGEKINLLISEDDEVVNPYKFMVKYKDNIRFIDRNPTGGHTYENLETKVNLLNNLLFGSLMDDDDAGQVCEDWNFI